MAKGKRKIKHIIIHHSASPIDRTTPERIRKWHVEDRGWSDIGYHYIIKNDATVFKARPENKKGAHCIARNHDSIGICVVGNYENEMPRKPMMDTLETLIQRLLETHNLTWADVSAHKDHSPTACPGQHMYEMLWAIKQKFI